MSKAKREIKTEQEFMLAFLVESVGLYVKNKSNEHTGVSDNALMSRDTQEDLSNLLDGLKKDAQGKISDGILKNMQKAIKDNLGAYVSKLDQELSESRNKILSASGVYDADSLKADDAMKVAGEKLGKKLQEIKVDDLKTVFSTIRDLCKGFNLDEIANIFDWMHQREQAKLIIKSLGVHQDPVIVEPVNRGQQVSKDSLTR